MYKHLHTRIFYITAIIVLLYLDWKYDLPWYSYLILYVCYLLTAFWGTYYMHFNYFLYSYCKGSDSKKQIAITFDDGPMPDFTPQVLDILKAQNVPAAFFLIGKNIEGNEPLVQRIVSEGHLIGNHSYNHGFWFSLQRKKVMDKDLQLCDNAILKATGLKPTFFRPPYGVTNPWVAKVIKRRNYNSIGWSIRTYDTGAKSGEALLKKSLKNLSNGDVILFHDWGKYTVGILSDFIKEARARGFEIVRADTLFGLNPYNE